MSRLPREFYQRDPVTVARALLGQRLVRLSPDGQRVSGRIVETEAYLGVQDKAAHTFNGRRTRRNATMWGPAGHAYVYFTYGMHHCLNLVTNDAEEPTAVLIRALEPEEGVERMQARRPKAKRPTDLCSGPAKLCQALDLTLAHDGEDVVGGSILLVEAAEPRALPEGRIVATTRIGIHYAQEWVDKPLRFYIQDNPHVSKR